MLHAKSSKGLIPKLSGFESTKISNRGVCCKQKMAQSPHDFASETSQHCTKFDRLHLDLMGPLGLPSAHGSCSYFQTRTDVGTRLSFVNFLKAKSDALLVSKVLSQALETKSKTNLKSLRNDRGGECVFAAWNNCVQIKGISYELIAPYSPQQNRMAFFLLEITLLERMRCLLIWSEIAKVLLRCGFATSNMLRNIHPTSALKGGIPIEAWSGKTPSFQKFHTFGSFISIF